MDSKQDKNRSSLEHKRFVIVTKKCIELQVPSLFQDNTVSWVRIVNGVDRYVTESMPAAKEEDDSFEETHC